MIISKKHVTNNGDINIINSYDKNGHFQGKGIAVGGSGDYMAVNDQNNNNVNTLDEINNNIENKN